MNQLCSATLRYTFGVLALVATWSKPLNAQETWHREQYMSENGLLQNRVHVMVRDRWGALLIGTEGGLVRFDGHHFKQLGIPSAEGMKPSRVLEIQPTTEGDFVIRDAGCRQFLYRHETLLSITGDAPTRQYASRFSGAIGTAALAVKVMDPDSAMPLKEEWPFVVRSVPLSEGRWCLRADNEVLVYQDTRLLRRIKVPMGRSAHIFMAGGHVFVLDSVGAFYRLVVDEGKVYPVVARGLPAPEVRREQLTWRLFWDTQADRATLVIGDRLYVLKAEADGSALNAKHIAVDLPEGQKVGDLIWLDGSDALAVGTDTKGLFIFRRQRMRSLLCEGLSEGVNNAYNAQASFGEDEVITSTRRGSRLFGAAGCTGEYAAIKGFNENAVLRDGQDRYWYGRGDTLFRFERSTQQEKVLRVGIRPLCFLEEKGVVWVGASNGVHQAVDSVITLTHPLAVGDLSARPTSLCRTPKGELWMASCIGVFRAVEKGGWEPVKGLERICARTLEVVDGNVFVGSYGGGAYMARPDGHIYRLPQDDQGFLSHVHSFMPDEAGFLWMSTNQGLFRVKLTDLEVWTRDTTQRTFYAYYGKKAGINNAEFNGGCSPSYVRTRNGWASLPTMDGLVWFRPGTIPDAYPHQDIHLESVLVDGERQPNGSIRLPWGYRELVVTLSIAYWGDPENVRLEYAFGEQDDHWISMPTGQRELRFTGLSQGDHRLRIRKVGALARGDKDVVQLHIAVEAPFFRRPWFIVLCTLAAALLFLGAIRLNATRLRRRNIQLERKVADRTRELVEANADLRRSLEMKEMLVSIISHDIVTPLRFIARVASGASRRSLPESEKRLAESLAALANSSEKLYTNAQGLLQWVKRQDGRIELRPRNVVVHLLVEEVLSREHERAVDNDIHLENRVPLDDIILTDRNVLSIVLHNAVANAVTHSGAGTVVVSGVLSDGAYRLVVKDSGLGMPEAVLRHAQRVQDQGALGAMGQEGERDIQGLGLLIIADLMQLLGGRMLVESQEGRGTSIILELPLDPDSDQARQRS